MSDRGDQNLVITPGSASVKLSPAAFHIWATDFLRAAREYVPPPHFSPVPYFLFYRSLELEIKSRLLSTRTLADVKDYGHRILRAYQALPDHQRILTPTEETTLQRASTFYNAKDLEYWNASHALRAYKDIRALAAVEPIAIKLLKSGDHTPGICEHP